MITSADKGFEEIKVAEKDDDIVGISTGLPQLDRIIGNVRGYPVGRVILLTGKYSTGKSSLALFGVAEAQKQKKKCLWVDTEMTFDKEHSVMCGVDNSKLLLMRQSAYAEKVFDSIEDFATKNKNVFIVLDSFSGLSIRDEIEKDASGADFGAKSKMLARFFRKVKIQLALNNNTLIIMGHEYPSMQGNYLVLAGGDSMSKVPSLWIDLYRPGLYLKAGEERVGEVIRANVKKNKIGGKKYAECDLQFVFGEGWNKVSDLMQEALDKGIISKEGQFFYFQGEKIARGQNGLREALKDEALQGKVKEALQ